MSDRDHCNLHNAYLASEYRAIYEDRFDARGYGVFLEANLVRLLDERFPIKINNPSGPAPVLTEVQMNTLAFHGMYGRLTSGLDRIARLPKSPLESDQDWQEEALTKLVYETARRAVAWVLAGEGLGRWTLPVREGILTEDYWRARIGSPGGMIDRIPELRKVEILGLARAFEGDSTPFPDLYATNTAFRRLVIEVFPILDPKDWAQKTGQDVLELIEDECGDCNCCLLYM